jgi:hypothetical protein
MASERAGRRIAFVASNERTEQAEVTDSWPAAAGTPEGCRACPW